MKKIKVILYQKSLGIPITRTDIKEMQKYAPHFVCFPEYFFVNQRLGNHGQSIHNQNLQIKRIKLLSKELNAVIIGGTMPELADGVMYNTTYIYHNGTEMGSYRKKNLFFAEVGKITPGNELKIFSAYGFNFGVLICADVFHDESFLFMKEHNAKIIFSPTFSLIKKDESAGEKFKRDNDIYVRGAGIADSVIVKVCGVRSDYKTFLQARSLIADKNEVLYRVKPEEEHTQMIIKREITIDE
ncbi:MAG TPA: carbon-nitrogen hydrolase family protein [Spirochaetota bacterium]|nr:carbon-nitrogen hydrolase family protein [Spirochaetota bacterium]HPS87767.1 carbon-nitrogen hydrolase family protein [Spirochaetota bacterium]